MSEETKDLLGGDTETATNVENQVTNPTAEVSEESEKILKMSQTQFESVIQDRLNRQRRMLEKKYEGVDVNEFKKLTEAEENRKIEEQKKRGEFESILKATVSKKDSTIQALQNEIKSIKVDGALLNAASNYKAVAPKQVADLLKDAVRLTDEGSVEVIDPASGNVRYNDKGEHMTTDSLVKEFMSANPWFATANSAGSGSQSNVNHNQVDRSIDVSKLDMRKASDRELYKKLRN